MERHAYAILRRYHCEHLAADHLQDIVNFVWKDLLENLYKYDGGDFELWFAYRRVRRVLDYLRKEWRQFPVHPNPEGRPQPRDGPEEGPERKVLIAQIRRRIDELPPRQALVLKLYYWENLRYREIGLILGLKVNSVGTLHTRGLRALRDLLKEPSVGEDESQ